MKRIFNRELIQCAARIDTGTLSGDARSVFEADIVEWVTETGKGMNHPLLLAHSEEGVIWGILEDNGLVTSHAAAATHPELAAVCPELRPETVIQLRLFDENTEYFLWKTWDGSIQWRKISDISGDAPAFRLFFDEQYLLWGTQATPLDARFSVFTDGAKGFRNVVPIPVASYFEDRTYPLRLNVRHYIKEDDNGVALIAATRLMNLVLEDNQNV